VKVGDSGAPPSSLKVDVDVVPPSSSIADPSQPPAVESGTSYEEEEFYDGFPLSEAPTLARKPPEPARRIVLKGASSDPFIVASTPPKARHRAAWFAAAAIVIAGTITAARLVRTENRVPTGPVSSSSRDTLATGSAAALAAARTEDAGLENANDTEDEGAVTGSQLEAKLAEEIARVAAAAEDAAAAKPLPEVAKAGTSKAAPPPARAVPPRPAARVPAKPTRKPNADVQTPPPAPSGYVAPKKSSVEREYGI
jgi:hypothetical protein